MSAFASLAAEPRWVTWRNEQRGGKTTKVPHSPHGGKAKADDPTTWGTRAQAADLARRIVNGQGGGIGIELGDIGSDLFLVGIDLDSCIAEDGTLASWAAAILDAAQTYTEISPSGRGLKLFAYLCADDVRPFLDRIGVPATGWGCRRGIGEDDRDHGPAAEIYCAARYFAVTDRLWPGAPDHLRTLDADDLDCLAPLIPPPAKATASATKTGRGDTSRSAAAFRKGAALRRAGKTYEQMVETLLADPETAAWAREKGQAAGGRELKRIWAKAEQAARNLPIIKISGGGLPAMVDQVDEIVVEHDPELFQRGGMIVRPAKERIDIRDGGKTLAWRFVRVEKAHLVDRLTRIVDFQKYNKRDDEWHSINCPGEVAQAYLERVGYWSLPVVAGIVDAPTLRPDGTVIETPGYDDATGLLYKPTLDYKPILTQPTKEQAQAALEHLCELISKFSFVDADGNDATAKPSPSRSVALSLILTACARHAIERAPLHGFDAPVAGSGKSLLVDIASTIAAGHEAAVLTVAKSEEEFEKRLGAALLAGDPLLSLDNCERPLGGELLCQCLTQRRVKVRILGKSEQPAMLCDATFAATGNNLMLAGDVTRRAIVARLDPKTERPEEREFDENPVDAIKRDRASYVRAALTILRAYVVAGKPKQQVKPLGSYEQWSALIRSALIWLGQPDPVATMEKVRNEDPILQALSEVLNRWLEATRVEVTVKRIVEIANETVNASADPHNPKYEIQHPDLRDALAAVAGDQRGNINTVTLGKWLGKNKGRVVSGLRFERGAEKANGGLVRWRVVGSQ